jgi:hypothetical protein
MDDRSVHLERVGDSWLDCNQVNTLYLVSAYLKRATRDDPIIIIHLLGLAPAGWLAAPDSGP